MRKCAHAPLKLLAAASNARAVTGSKQIENAHWYCPRREPCNCFTVMVPFTSMLQQSSLVGCGHHGLRPAPLRLRKCIQDSVSRRVCRCTAFFEERRDTGVRMSWCLVLASVSRCTVQAEPGTHALYCVQVHRWCAWRQALRGSAAAAAVALLYTAQPALADLPVSCCLQSFVSSLLTHSKPCKAQI